ncbi:MAG: hypothetical protein JMN24_18160 [gamma proteobacterium endosymbiont of Lamellibrachia anaximandri]|nr:hypothetical protein [gamma proteobacterium endosymbiont of Lamellibrachia anaximandri]MBL3619424.1 hypothetical protein [gamma proteobacterium endosymbiont of Lamellibrachia anaximandri]
MATLDWNVEDYLKRHRPSINTKRQQTGRRINQLSKEDITLDDIINAYEVVARIVTIYGDIYLPIFERLHREIEEHKMKNKMLNIAKDISCRKLSTDK